MFPGHPVCPLLCLGRPGPAVWMVLHQRLLLLGDVGADVGLGGRCETPQVVLLRVHHQHDR